MHFAPEHCQSERLIRAYSDGQVIIGEQAYQQSLLVSETVLIRDWRPQGVGELVHSDFDYLLECYVPAPKRRYGYFALPLLLGYELIGRMDARADRKQHHLTIRNLVLEAGVRVDESLAAALSRGILVFAANHDATTVSISRSEPAGLARQLEPRLAGQP